MSDIFFAVFWPVRRVLLTAFRPRCVLLTGKHLGHAEVRGNMQAKLRFPESTEGQYPLTKEAQTFVQLFQKAGYITGAMGKWGLGPVGSTGDPNRKGFDLFFEQFDLRVTGNCCQTKRELRIGKHA